MLKGLNHVLEVRAEAMILPASTEDGVDGNAKSHAHRKIQGSPLF